MKMYSPFPYCVYGDEYNCLKCMEGYVLNNENICQKVNPDI